ncbi:MAG: hypothetical protein LZF62_480048 [Nitrospira sp.]|nr:MAG: hypothetical protein LZF62_480048 [Nitrospira sp.]
MRYSPHTLDSEPDDEEERDVFSFLLELLVNLRLATHLSVGLTLTITDYTQEQ